LIQNHRLLLSVGHDEYWSSGQQRHVEAARNVGVHLAFLSANEMFLKIRWEPSITDGRQEHDPYRTIVCYKEMHASAKIDPHLELWMGMWRDSCSFNPQGAHPENSLTGTFFIANACCNGPS
jgi:hypothetical protein